MKYRKYPNFVKAVAERHVMYNDTLDYIEQREKEGKLFVIAPDTDLPVGKTEKDPEKLCLCHRIGYETAKKQMDAVKAFLL